jgi:hypothetical protein
MFFNFPYFIINGTTIDLYINYINGALSWHIKNVRNKVLSATNIRGFERRHEAWIQKIVYCL